MFTATYIINLASSTGRWQGMQPLLEQMRAPSPVRFDAVDGSGLGPGGIASMQATGRLSHDLSEFDTGCLAGEIGCALSHAGVLADIVERQLPSAMILEDDIELAGAARTWPARFERALADLPPTWELWYLYRCFDIEHRVQRLSPRTVIPWTPQGGAAYAVTLEGARKLLAAMTPVSSAVDRIYEQLVRTRALQAFAASPLLIRPGSHPSVINRDNPDKKWVKNGVNRPPEYWPKRYLAHLGEALPETPRPSPRRVDEAPGALPSAVYFVVWWFDKFGGMERHVTDIATSLARRGVAVTVFSETPVAPSNHYAMALRAAGVRIVAPPRAAALAARLDRIQAYRLVAGLNAKPGVGWAGIDDEYLRHQYSPQSTRHLFSALERHANHSPPDVVHVHGCRLGQHRVLQWAASRRIPCVYTEHITMADWDGPFDSEAPWIVGSTADAMACVSERSRESLLDTLPWPSEIHVARHIVRDPRLKDPEAGLQRRAPDQPMPSPVSILAVGRLVWYKGYDTLLYAASLLRQGGIAFELRIAGSGEQLQALLDLRARLDLDDCVTFLGQVEQTQVAELWKAADIGVVPSLTEGLPLSVIEAMAQARPIVATRVGGIPEVVRHEQNGLLVEAADAVVLAAAIRRVIEDPALAARLAAEARRSFEDGGWSEESVIGQTLSIYGEASRVRKLRMDTVEGANLRWARELASKAGRPLRRVCVFAWDLSDFGDMEYLAAEQTIALALAGVEVLLFVETPLKPFNPYVRRMRSAGVRVILPSLAGSLAHRLWARVAGRGASTPLSRVFAKTCASQAPDAIFIHGWRLGAGWASLTPILQLARTKAVASIYVEHATEDGWHGPPDDEEKAAIRAADCLCGASAAAGAYLNQTLVRTEPVAFIRHAGAKPQVPPKLGLKPLPGLRAFCLIPPGQIPGLARAVKPKGIRIDPAGALAGHAGKIAACDVAVLSPQAEGFGVALAEAMSAFKPIIVCDCPGDAPIRNRANGFTVDTDPDAALTAAALIELAADPVLAHQFALAARRTFELGGLRDLAVVGEAIALHRAATQAREPADAGG